MIKNILGWKYNWKFALSARAFWKLGRIFGWCIKHTHTNKNDSNMLDTTTHPTDQEKKKKKNMKGKKPLFEPQRSCKSDRKKIWSIQTKQ